MNSDAYRTLRASRCVSSRNLLHDETILTAATVAGTPAISLLVVPVVSPEPGGCVASHEHRVLVKLEEGLKVTAGDDVTVVVESEANYLMHSALLSDVR